MAAPLGDLQTLGMTGSHVTVGAGAGEVVAGGQDRPGGEGHRTGEQGSDSSRARALGCPLADYPGSPSSSGLCCGSGRQSPALCTSTMSQGSASTSSPRPLSLLPWNERKVALSSTSIGLWGLGAPRLPDLARVLPSPAAAAPQGGFPASCSQAVSTWLSHPGPHTSGEGGRGWRGSMGACLLGWQCPPQTTGAQEDSSSRWAVTDSMRRGRFWTEPMFLEMNE